MDYISYEAFRSGRTNIKHARDENLCLGWMVTLVDNRETLYALHRDGRVLVSGPIAQPNHDFNKKGRVWQKATDVPMDAEFIGNYPADMFT